MMVTYDSHLYTFSFSKGKVGYPWESTRDIYPHIPLLCMGHISWLFLGQYAVIPYFGNNCDQVPSQGYSLEV